MASSMSWPAARITSSERSTAWCERIVRGPRKRDRERRGRIRRGSREKTDAKWADWIDRIKA